MVDLTLNKEDKDTYIIDLILNEDNTYTMLDLYNIANYMFNDDEVIILKFINYFVSLLYDIFFRKL